MPSIRIEVTEKELKKLVYDHLAELLGTVEIKPDDVKIEVKSTQNYKSEWEPAAFRARIEVVR